MSIRTRLNDLARFLYDTFRSRTPWDIAEGAGILTVAIFSRVYLLPWAGTHLTDPLPQLIRWVDAYALGAGTFIILTSLASYGPPAVRAAWRRVRGTAA